MSQRADAIRGTVWEDEDVTCLARVKLNGAVASFVQSAISTISRSIFNRKSSTPTTVLSTDSLTVASTVFDALQTDGRWSLDSTGYNFRDVIPASKLVTGTADYRVEYKITTTGGSIFFLVFEVKSMEVYTS